MSTTNPNLSPEEIRDLDLFQAVIGAAIKGVPLEEAVTLITGAPEQWDDVLARVIDSFKNVELVE
jgi:hypothetical protein